MTEKVECSICYVLETTLQKASSEVVLIVGMVTGFKLGQHPGAFSAVELCDRHLGMFIRAANPKQKKTG